MSISEDVIQISVCGQTRHLDGNIGGSLFKSDYLLQLLLLSKTRRGKQLLNPMVSILIRAFFEISLQLPLRDKILEDHL